MDPSGENIPMPPAMPERVEPVIPAAVEQDRKTPETAPEQPVEQSGAQINRTVNPPPLVLPPVAAPVQPTTTVAEPSLAKGTPAIAEDLEVIEKQWVKKVEEVVRQTRKDPHEQSRAAEVIKVDYRTKRKASDKGVAAA